MYEELVYALKKCGYPGDVHYCRDCVFANDGGTCHRKKLLPAAADAIEELSAIATPKRVGFTQWKGYRNTRYKCPYCNKNVRNDEAYCHKCGQALMFPRISFTPYVQGETQEVIIEWPDEPPKEET